MLCLLEKERQKCENKSSSNTFHWVTAFENPSCSTFSFISPETCISPQDRSVGWKRPEGAQLPRINILLVSHKFLNSDLAASTRARHHLSHILLKRIHREFLENKMIGIAQQANTSPAAPRKS